MKAFQTRSAAATPLVDFPCCSSEQGFILDKANAVLLSQLLGSLRAARASPKYSAFSVGSVQSRIFL